MKIQRCCKCSHEEYSNCAIGTYIVSTICKECGHNKFEVSDEDNIILGRTSEEDIDNCSTDGVQLGVGEPD